MRPHRFATERKDQTGWSASPNGSRGLALQRPENRPPRCESHCLSAGRGVGSPRLRPRGSLVSRLVQRAKGVRGSRGRQWNGRHGQRANPTTLPPRRGHCLGGATGVGGGRDRPHGHVRRHRGVRRPHARRSARIASWRRSAHRRWRLFDARVPYTSKNGCASVLVREARSRRADELLPVLRREMREWYVPGSDPGLCVADHVSEAVTAFGQRAQR